MGGDGGSIPKRTEMVKTKKKKASANDLSFGASLLSNWTHCKLSNNRLESPVLIDRLGNLFNKQAILQHLISRKHRKQNTSHMNNDLNYIQKFTKDLIHCKIRFRSDINNNSNGNDIHLNEGIFECPITGIVANGKYPFVCLTNCGCVISERAIKNVRSTDNCCLICNEPLIDGDIEYTLNVIPVNPLPERRILLLEDIQRVLKQRQIRKQKLRPKKKKEK